MTASKGAVKGIVTHKLEEGTTTALLVHGNLDVTAKRLQEMKWEAVNADRAGFETDHVMSRQI